MFRLNISLSKATFLSLFGAQPARVDADGTVDPNYDFTATDQLLPHPIYGRMYWVCIVNPSAATFATLKPLLAEAYELAVSKYTKRAARA